MTTHPLPPLAGVQKSSASPAPITGVPTAITAFVGYTDSGIDHQAQDVLSFDDFERLYGGLVVESELGYAVQQFFQNGGVHAVVVRTPGADGGLPSSADLIGERTAFTGIYALLHVDLFNLLCIPDAVRARADDPTTLDAGIDTNAIYSAAMALCKERRAFLLVDPTPDLTTVAAAADWKANRLTLADPDGAAFFPRLQLADPLLANKLRNFAPCGVVAGVYASVDAKSGVWKSPAGTTVTLQGVLGLSCQINDQDGALLNPLALNCFRTLPTYGPLLWGARTLAGADAMASEWKYIAVRRTALFLEESIARGTQWTASEPNDEALWTRLRLGVGAFLHTLFLKGAFQGSKPAEAYLVKCDADTTTQDDIDNGMLNLLVGFAAMKPAEFILLQIALPTTQPGRKPSPPLQSSKQAQPAQVRTPGLRPKP